MDFAARVGARDCYSNKDFHEIITKKEDFYKIKIEFEKLAKNLIYSGIEWRPKSNFVIKEKQTEEIEDMLDLLEQDDDVQGVFHNCKFT